MKKRNRKNPMNFAIQVRMYEEMYNKIEQQALQTQTSPAEVIRKLIKESYELKSKN